MLSPGPPPYDPWRVVRADWPGVEVITESMPGDLLGEIRCGGRLIVLRAGTTQAQRRCTLAHEIVHLERGIQPRCAVLHSREELAVHRRAARRLLPLLALEAAIRGGCGPDERELAVALEVDRYTLRTRWAELRPEERSRLRSAAWVGRPAA